ncbi:hypothetical protein MLD38_028649 [Melastoma candidum]|uniref:Uncharacterized protein n=1 Tax=Melastoma candidum TaxID=119954 RepID=A0ACB9N1P6_9MYRT|nr:hypothetical protein MLD38_028649 [Melastoma candidum]
MPTDQHSFLRGDGRNGECYRYVPFNIAVDFAVSSGEHTLQFDFVSYNSCDPLSPTSMSPLPRLSYLPQQLVLTAISLHRQLRIANAWVPVTGRKYLHKLRIGFPANNMPQTLAELGTHKLTFNGQNGATAPPRKSLPNENVFAPVPLPTAAAHSTTTAGRSPPLGLIANAKKYKHSFIHLLTMSGILLLSLRSLGQKYRIHDRIEDTSSLEEEKVGLSLRMESIKRELCRLASSQPSNLFSARLEKLFREE